MAQGCLLNAVHVLFKGLVSISIIRTGKNQLFLYLYWCFSHWFNYIFIVQLSRVMKDFVWGLARNWLRIHVGLKTWKNMWWKFQEIHSCQPCGWLVIRAGLVTAVVLAAPSVSRSLYTCYNVSVSCRSCRSGLCTHTCGTWGDTCSYGGPSNSHRSTSCTIHTFWHSHLKKW